VSEVLPAVCDTWWGFRAWQLRRERLQQPSALLVLFDYAHLFHIFEKLPGLDPDFCETNFFWFT
jgi:hypothetical protein